jgi:hypothetical protein
MEVLFSPTLADLGYHAKFPREPGQEPTSKECKYCDGEPCYYDGSGLNAQKVFDLLVEKGDEAVWKFLENYYNERVRPTPADIYLESIGEEAPYDDMATGRACDKRD